MHEYPENHHDVPDSVDVLIAQSSRAVTVPSALGSRVATRIDQSLRRTRRFMIGTVVTIMVCAVSAVLLIQPPDPTAPSHEMIASNSEAADVRPADEPVVVPSTSRRAHVRFDPDANVIAVEPQTSNPKITVIMLYQAVETAEMPEPDHDSSENTATSHRETTA